MDRAGAAGGPQEVLGPRHGLGMPTPELCLSPTGGEVRRQQFSEPWRTRGPGQTCAPCRAQQAPGGSRRQVACSPTNVHLSLGPCPQSLECRQAEGRAQFPSTSCLPPTDPTHQEPWSQTWDWALRNPWLGRESSDTLQGFQDSSPVLPPKGLAWMAAPVNTAPLQPLLAHWETWRPRGSHSREPLLPGQRAGQGPSLLTNVSDVGRAGR